MKIKKGDKVKIILGKDRGREGQVEKFSQSRKVLVAGLNLYKKHVRPKKKGKKRRCVETSRPLAVSKVALVCPKVVSQQEWLPTKEKEKNKRLS